MPKYDSTTYDWYQIWPDQKSSNQLYGNQIWPPIAWMDWEAQMEAEWEANGGLMGMMGMTGKLNLEAWLALLVNWPLSLQPLSSHSLIGMLGITNNSILSFPSFWLLLQATTWSRWCRWWRWRRTASASPPTWPMARWPCPPWLRLAGNRTKKNNKGLQTRITGGVTG